MSANPVADTISEIMKRMSSLRGFGPNITENIKYHLTVIKDKCSGLAKLDLSDPETREWVGQVTDLFYLVDDLCDDVAPLSKQSKNRSLFSACKLAPLLQLKQIEKRLLRKVAPMKNVKMLTGRDAKEEGEAETAVRDYVKKTIRGSILKKEKGVVRVVVIHGITGMGKAKVAKYVCEDEEVKSLFDVMTWIDGDHLQGYYAESVVDRVNHGLEEEKKKEDSDNVKGFLVILNNFQNENQEEWLKLANNLKGVAAASSVGGTLVLTTMSFAVLRSFRYKFEVSSAHWFDWLNSRESLALFKQFAGTSASAIESTTRDALLEMCGGVVGAIETVARLVRSRKQTTESDINELKDEFVQEMQLKYYSELDLPSWRLWQCFAYSLFLLSSQNSGKGECVKREKLVRLWMAEGFLGDSSSSSSEPEDLGHEYIQEFLRRSIFTENEDGEISIYKRQALAAAFVVGNDSALVEDKAIIDNHARRVSLKSGLDVSYGNPRSLFETKESVRNFHLESSFVAEEKQSRPPNQVMLSWSACDAILSAFRRLRVLTLKDLGMKVLPASIGDLKSLRYLDLSRNNLQQLPICVGDLQHLQTLLLSHCLKLGKLPDDVNHFASLRYLEVDQCPNLMHMPSALKKLTWLRSLHHFVASGHNGIGELIHLNELRGDLEISHLERFTFKGSFPAHAYLKEKQHLEGLTLRWNPDDEKKHSSEDDQNRIMLKHLEPHPNLKRLFIIGYQGNQFAGWLSSLKNLVEISLYNCPNCQSLPTLDHVLINLKKLTLMSLDSLQFVTVTDKDNGCKELQLKRVRISDCPNLVSWWKPGTHDATVFSTISELVVEYCPRLVSMPLFSKLDNKLVLDSSNMEPLLNTPLSKLTILEIINVNVKKYPQPEEWLKNFTSLKSLVIRDCKALNSINGWKHLTSLDSLQISNCTDIDLKGEEWKGMENLSTLVIEDMSNLESLPKGIEHLALLESLVIKNCPNLTTLPENLGKNLPSAILIEDCPKLASLPEKLRDLLLLEIRNCPLLEAWNQRRPKLVFNPLQQLDSLPRL